MQPDFLDRHSRLGSPVHRLPAALKLCAALALVCITSTAPRDAVAWFAGVAVLLSVVAAASRVPPRFLLTRLLLLEPFVLGVAVLSLFQPGGGRIFTALLIKSTLCLFTMILLASTTPFAEILRVLRRLRVPPLLVTTLALLYRYLFVLVDEARRMQRARAGRTFRRSRRQSWRMLGTLAGELLVRSTERAERIYAAMCARGWK
jgi:cobalt/nickel transport system permease protein